MEFTTRLIILPEKYSATLKQIAHAIGMEQDYKTCSLYALLPELKSNGILRRSGEMSGYRGGNAIIFVFNRDMLIKYLINHKIEIRTLIHLQDEGQLEQSTVDLAHSFFQ